MNKNRGQRRSAYYCAKAETSPFSKLRQRPCPHLSCAPPGAPFLSRQERGKECGLREALTAACSRRRADVLVVRLPPAIDSLDSLRDAPPSLKNSFRHAIGVEKQCFGEFLLRPPRCIRVLSQTNLYCCFHEVKTVKTPGFSSIPRQCAHWHGIHRMIGY